MSPQRPQLLYRRGSSWSSSIHRQTYPLLILLIKLSHQSRNPKLFTFKDNPVKGSPDPPEDSDKRHEQRLLMYNRHQPLKKKWEGMTRQPLTQIFQTRIVPKRMRHRTIEKQMLHRLIGLPTNRASGKHMNIFFNEGFISWQDSAEDLLEKYLQFWRNISLPQANPVGLIHPTSRGPPPTPPLIKCDS
ncbi:unnamed protein product [Linum trigynum]|uniref:Uncharacterized protein n=1 Tax=Linum trigynum TaxID=586398 RepID=A0AAV2GC55_9ROSI